MSEFGNNAVDYSPPFIEEELPLQPDSPYKYCRTRVYGRLHFVKRVRPEHVADPVYTAALAKEFEIGYSLEHPHIARYLRYEDGAVYQEYVDGSTLAELLASDDPSLRDRATAVRILTEILDALGCLHANGIAYLDLKPQNIMLTRIGRSVKIVDLGSCASGMHDLTPGFTREYAAPEQRDNQPADARTDIYQFGLIARKVLLRCGFDKRYGHFIARCLAENPDHRFADAHAALHTFTRLSESRERRHRLLIYAIAGVFAIFVTIAVYFAYDSRNHEYQMNSPASFTAHGTTSGEYVSDSVAPANQIATDVNTNRNSSESTENGKVSPDGSSNHDEAMRKQLKESIELDVWVKYSDALHSLIGSYKSKGLSYRALDKERKTAFDHKLDSLRREIEAEASEAALMPQDWATPEEVKKMFMNAESQCRHDAKGFKF